MITLRHADKCAPRGGSHATAAEGLTSFSLQPLCCRDSPHNRLAIEVAASQGLGPVVIKELVPQQLTSSWLPGGEDYKAVSMLLDSSRDPQLHGFLERRWRCDDCHIHPSACQEACQPVQHNC